MWSSVLCREANNYECCSLLSCYWDLVISCGLIIIAEVREHYVAGADTGGGEWMGWLATPLIRIIIKTIPKEMMYTRMMCNHHVTT